MSRLSFTAIISATLLLMLVAVQGYLLAHEVEHALHNDDDESCLVCQLANHQSNVLLRAADEDRTQFQTAQPPVISLSIWFHQSLHFSARAPPALTIL